MPALFLSGELPLAGGAEGVGADAAAGFTFDPFGPDPTGFFHAMKGWVKRALFKAKNIVRCFANRGHDGVAVETGAAEEQLEDE